MVQKNNLDLHRYIADEALKARFDKSVNLDKELKEFRELVTTISIADRTVKQLYLRLRKRKENNIAVDTVLASLEPCHRALIEEKYGKPDRSLVAIGLSLHVSTAQLEVWLKNIQVLVYEYLQYKITSDDLFFKTKIINMLNILKETLMFYNQIDPNRIVVDIPRLDALTRRRDNYQQILDALNRCQDERKLSIQKNVIATQIERPCATRAELADICICHRGSVTRYLGRFIDDMQVYLTT